MNQHLGYNADASANGGRFGLGSAHSAQTRGQEDPAGQVVQTEVAPTGVQYRQLVMKIQYHGGLKLGKNTHNVKKNPREIESNLNEHSNPVKPDQICGDIGQKLGHYDRRLISGN